MSNTKLQLINYIYDQGATPPSPPSVFIQHCRTWLDPNFADKSHEIKDEFANKTFHSTVSRKFSQAKNKANLLQKAANKAFFAQHIFPPDDSAPSPPQQQKLDDSGLSDVLLSKSHSQTDATGPDSFLKVCKDYFKTQSLEAL